MSITAFIFDIDGTLADGRHRQHLVQQKPKNWPAYQRLAYDDAVYSAVASALHSVNGKHKVFILSGRQERERGVTFKWFADKIGINHSDHAVANDSIPEMYMRATNDHREDSIIKREMYHNIIVPRGYKILGVFDDRNRVVQMWRQEGLFVFHVDQTSVSQDF